MEWRKSIARLELDRRDPLDAAVRNLGCHDERILVWC